MRLMKDPIKRKDGVPSFKFVFHPSTRLPTLNAAGKTFRSRDLYKFFEAAQINLKEEEYDAGPSILRLYIYIAAEIRKMLEAKVSCIRFS